MVTDRIVAIRVAKGRRHRMWFATPIGIGVAVVAADVTDEVIGIRVGVAACAGGTEGRAAGISTKGAGQPIQLVVVVALLLAAVDDVGEALDVAAVVKRIVQVLQVGACARTRARVDAGHP